MHISRRSVAEAACHGMKRSFDVYAAMSRDWKSPAERGIEGFISGYVGLSIRRRTDLSVGLEVGIREIEDNCQVRRKGPVSASLRVTGRCDVVAWHGERPVCALEVKRGFWTDKIRRDIERLDTLKRRMADAGKPLQLVGVVFPDAARHEDPKARAEHQQERITRWLKEELGPLGRCHVERLPIGRYTRGEAGDRYYSTAWCGIVRV